MADLIVRWDQPRVHNIGVMQDGKEATIKLLPGVNVVDEDLWNAAMHPDRKDPKKVNKILKDLVDEQLLIVKKVEATKTKVGEEADDTLDTLKGMNVTDAFELIKETYTHDLLKKWKKGEKRVKVLAALKKQIKLIEAPTEDAKDDE